MAFYIATLLRCRHLEGTHLPAAQVLDGPEFFRFFELFVKDGGEYCRERPSEGVARWRVPSRSDGGTAGG
jgi:hypothetical protein